MKNTVLTFGQAKKEHKKQTMLTAYDYSTEIGRASCRERV